MTSSVHRKSLRNWFASHEDRSAADTPPIPTLRCPTPSSTPSSVHPHCRDEQSPRTAESTHDVITQPDVLSDTTRSLNSVSLLSTLPLKTEHCLDKSSSAAYVKTSDHRVRDKVSMNDYSKPNSQSFRWSICSEEEELEEESEPCSWNVDASQSTHDGCVPSVPQSASYFQPRTLAGYIKYLEPVHLEGCLEKQSVKNRSAWKQRWFVMQTSQLIYYKSARDVPSSDSITHPRPPGCRGVIELDQVDSVTTAKEFGVGAFQIRCHHRKYVLRAESKDRMQDWLFNFQRSIANIISMLLQTVHSHANRPHRDTDFHLTRKRRTARSSRSISLDLHDIDAFGPCDLHLAPDDSESSSSAMSPRKSSAFRPKSPLGMFDFDLSEENESSTPSNVMPPRNYHRSRRFSTSFSTDTRMLSNSFRPSDTATETHQMEQHDHDTQRPLPVTRAYVPRYIRDRENATAVTPPTSPLTSGRWTSRHHNEREETRTLDSMVDMTTTDAFSYTDGNEAYGVTSLLGVRNNMEDLCCCIPDLNAHFALEYCQKQAIYALFDGHAGVQAAQFANDRLAAYICAHHDFYSNTRRAFDECFRRVDKEFLAQAAIEKWSAGTTVALVFIRGNKLLTANIGDSRAVVCLGEDALDVIEEQTPGRKDERDRIEQQGGWVKEERELHISKLHSMDLSDPRIKEKAERIVRWVHIYRVNGELAVSRAIGDLEYKGRALSEYAFWAFPEGHDRVFHGDLVIPVPEFKEIEITSDVAFLILACDGLWDTITSQEAVRHVRERLQKGETAEIASRSLANLAIRSGSSDNVSVIVVRFNCNCGN